jgi:hypothetical protein
MTGRKGLVGWLVLSFLVGGIAGVALGGYQGVQKGASLILNECLSKDAREIGTRVAVLGNLRAGKLAPALESLEAGMDDLLVGFDPVEPYPGLTAQTTAALAKAIGEARAYRLAHPRQSRAHARDAMVRNLLARERYK